MAQLSIHANKQIAASALQSWKPSSLSLEASNDSHSSQKRFASTGTP